MGLNRRCVGRAERARRVGKRCGRVADARDDRILDARRVANVFVEVAHRRQLGPVGPAHLQVVGGLDRIPFPLGDDAEEVLEAHDLGAVRGLAVARAAASPALSAE